MSFLKAEWRKLVMANYSIEPSILAKYLPNHTELDLFQDKCYISVVGFMFINTKIMRMKIPFHVNFEEVNLRFYVKHLHQEEWRRGVVFIKELVPKRALTLVANRVYKENYETVPMSHYWTENVENRSVSYTWQKGTTTNEISVVASIQSEEISKGSHEEFITEHYWGYARINASKTNEYEVTHPRWEHYPVSEYNIAIDFEKTYGKDFTFLKDLKPDSVLLAEGSEITVENKTILP